MLKEKAVASLGQPSLLMPAWIKAALAANDRLKRYLTLLQSAAQHASAPDGPVGHWEKDIAHAGLQDAPWAQEMLSGAYYDDDLLILPHMENLLEALSNDLATMARPLCDAGQASADALTVRRDHWLRQLHALADDEGLRRAALAELTHGDRSAATACTCWSWTCTSRSMRCRAKWPPKTWTAHTPGRCRTTTAR